MPQPILFGLARSRNRGRPSSGLGFPPFQPSMPLTSSGQYLSIYGITKDSTGAVLPSCVVRVFRTVDDVEVDTTTSDATTGAYEFRGLAGGQTYYLVAYKAGSPDVAGTTVNTLVGGTPGAGILASAYRVAIILAAPIAYWRLGEISGTLANDEIGTNDGTYAGSPTLNSPAAIRGDPDAAVTFNGTSQSVSFADSSPFRFAGLLPFSVELWFNHPAPDVQFQRIISCETGAGNGWQLFSQNTAYGFVRKSATTTNEVDSLAPISAGWHHFVGTFDGLNIRGYMDGVQYGNPASTASLPADSTFRIGRHGGGAFGYFAGSIDEVAIYDRQLLAAEVAAHYAAAGY